MGKFLIVKKENRRMKKEYLPIDCKIVEVDTPDVLTVSTADKNVGTVFGWNEGTEVF